MKLFTNLRNVLLCGVAVAMVGCADFSEDIQRVDENLREDVSDLQATISALQVKLAEDYATKQSVEALKNELNGAIAGEVADLEKAIAAAVATLNEAINAKADEADLVAVEKTVEALQAELAAAKDALQKSLADAKAELKAADEANANAIKDLEARITAAEKSIEGINAAVATLQSDVESLKNAYMQNTQALTNLKNAYDKFVEETETNFANVKASVAALDAYVKDMEVVLHERINDVAETLTDAITLFTDEIELLRAEDNYLGKSIEDLQVSITNVINLLNDEAAAREDADEELWNAIYDAQAQIGSVHTQLLETQEDLGAEIALARAELGAAITSVLNQHLDLVGEVADIEARLSAQEAALVAYKKVVDEAIAALQAESANHTLAITNLQGMADKAAADIEDINAELAAINAKIEALQNAHAELIAGIQNMKGAIDAQFTTVDEAIDAIHAELAKFTQGIQNMKGELDATIAALEDKLEAYNKTIADVANEALKSLAFIPKVIDTDLNEVIDFYTVLRDKKNYQGLEYVASNKPTVSYRINPTNANLEGVEWSFIGRTAEIRTRAAGDVANFFNIVETVAPVNGEIKFVVETTTDLKNYDNYAEEVRGGKPVVDFVALQAQSEAYTIVSDFAAAVDTELASYAIVNVTEDNEEYFNVAGYYDYKKVAENQRPYYPAGVFYPAEETEALPVQLVHNESINLLEYVGTWCYELDDLLGKEYQIVPEYTFALVDKYLSPVDKTTDQQSFVVLEGDKVSVDVDFVKGVTEVAVGKTPVVEVISWYEGKEIAKAYIKIDIVETLKYKKEPVTYTVTPASAFEYTKLPCDQFKYDSKNYSGAITWVDLTQNILADQGIKLPNEGFVQAYDFENVTSKVYYTVGKTTYQDEDVTGVEIKTLPNDNTAATTTPVAAFAVNCEINSANGNGQVEITIPSKDVYTYPDVTIIFNFSVSHETNLPKLYDKYAANNVVVVKGHEVEADGFAWSFEEVLHEAFDVATYKTYGCQKNHSPLAFRFADPKENRAVIEPAEDWLTQVISLKNVSEINWEKTNGAIEIPVELYTTLCNGEECVFAYTVRFVNPFSIEIADVELETKLTATTADLLDYVTIYFDGEPVYAEHAYTEFGVELGLVGVLTSEYEVINVPSNIAKEEGWLTCTKAGIITWNNGGTTLLANEVANSHAVAHLDAIGYFGGKGKVTFLATK